MNVLAEIPAGAPAMAVALIEAELDQANPMHRALYLDLLTEQARRFGAVPAALLELTPIAKAGSGPKVVSLFAFANVPAFEAFHTYRLHYRCVIAAEETISLTRPLTDLRGVAPGQLRIPYHLLSYH